MTQFDNAIVKGQERNCINTKVKKKKKKRNVTLLRHSKSHLKCSLPLVVQNGSPQSTQKMQFCSLLQP